MHVRRRRVRPVLPLRPRRARVGRGALRRVGLVATVFGVLLAGGPAAPAAGQVTTGAFDLLQLKREYEAARSACDAALLAREVEQPDYESAVAIARRADRSGDDAAYERAQQRFFEISQVIEERTRRIQETCRVAEGARATYVDGLDARRRALEDELAVAATPARRRALQGDLDDIANRYRELEEEGRGLDLRFTMRPLLEIDPRDTPDAVRAKASLLERRAQDYDSLLVTLNQEIERLESRIRTQRGRENFQAGLGRFDDTRTPVASNPREGSTDPTVAATDSTAMSGGSLEARLEAARAARLQLEHYRDQMRAKVKEFLDYLRTIT